MAKYGEESKNIEAAFETILYACENIKDYNQCEKCTLRHLCLDDPEVSVLDLGDLISADTWSEFLEFARDGVEWSKADADAQYADFMRKYEKEERMLDEYDG